MKSNLDSILELLEVRSKLEDAECSGNSHFEVTEKTMASKPHLVQLENIVEAFTAREDQTLGHDQESTLLCHSFATMSGFRQVLLDLTDKVKQNDVTLLATCTEIINQIETEQKGEFSFAKMLTGFLGCVSPRSFHCSSAIQSSLLKPIVARLCSKTAFEIEGWKRIIPVRRIFRKLNLKIDDYELSYEEAFHPNSKFDQQVLEKLKASNFDAFLNVMVELGKIKSDTFRKVLEKFWLKKDTSDKFSTVKSALRKRAQESEQFGNIFFKIDFKKWIQKLNQNSRDFQVKYFKTIQFLQNVFLHFDMKKLNGRFL